MNRVFEAGPVGGTKRCGSGLGRGKNTGMRWFPRLLWLGFVLASAPVAFASNPVQTQTIINAVEDTPISVDLNGYFADNLDTPPDNPITFSINNAPPGWITATTAGAILNLSFAANQHGTGVIRIKAKDANDERIKGDIDIVVAAVNDAPVTVGSAPSVNGSEDDPPLSLDVQPFFNDVDIATDGDSLSFSISGVTNGSLFAASPSLSGSVVTLTLAPNQHGSATVTVRATDGSGATVSNGVQVTIAPVNDAPFEVAPAADVTVAEDSASASVNMAAVFDDIDIPDGDFLTYAVVAVSNAVIFQSATPPNMAGSTLNLNFAANQNGTATVTVQATDTAGATATSDVNVIVSAVNDAPVTVGAAPPIATTEDSPPFSTNIAGLFDDVDIATNGDILSYSVTGFTNPSLYTAPPVIAAAAVSISLAANQNGSGTITVRATDLAGTSVSQTITVNVAPANDAPFVVAPAADVTVVEDSASASVNMAAVFDDIDIPDGDSLTYAVVAVSNAVIFQSATPPNMAGSTLNLNFAANQNGTATVTVQATDTAGATVTSDVKVIVSAVNDAPVVINPIADTTILEDAPDVSMLLVGGPTAVFDDVDIATNGDVLTFSVSNSNPGLFSLVDASSGSLQLSLTPDANGVATLSVQATDSAGASVSTSFTLTVTPVNDIPQGVDDAVTMAEDSGSIAIDVLANDQLGDVTNTITAFGITQTINGVAFPDSSESTPTTEFDIGGNLVTLPNGSMTLSAGGGPISYTPKANYSGTDFFTYTFEDIDGETSTATVTITVTAVNDPPVPVGSLDYSMVQATVLNIAADGGLANQAIDPDGDTISIVQVTGPTSRTLVDGSGNPLFPGTTLTLNSDGSFTYQPDVNFVGTDSFQIQFFDGTALSSVTTVTIGVTATPPPPPSPPAGEVEFPFNLADVPLEDAISAEANVLVVMDDSGSMDVQFLTNMPQGYFYLNNSKDKDSRIISRNIPYYWLLPLKTDICCRLQALVTEAALNADSDFAGNKYGVWRGRNAQFNTTYYNPKFHYTPWVGLNRKNKPFADANPKKALLDPYDVRIRKLNLTKKQEYDTAVPVLHRRRFGYKVISVEVYLPRYYTTPVAGRPAWNDPHTLVEIRDNGTIYTGSSSRDDCAVDDGDPLTCTYDQEIQNFANWFSYYRSREYTAKRALGQAVSDASNLRLGYVALNDSNERTAIKSMNASFRVGAKRAMMNQVYKVNSSGGTPLRSALDKAGRHFECLKRDAFGSRRDSEPGDPQCPILPSPEGQCQNNFTLLFTDGFWNGRFRGSKARNRDGPGAGNTPFDGGVYADNRSATLADVAMHYYERDLHPELLDGVPTTERDRRGAPQSAFGNQGETMHQHMTTYTVGFGLEGLIDPNTVPTDYTQPFAWSDPFRGGSAKVDDLLHAAVDGRGQFLQANNPVLLSQAFQNAFQEFSDGSVSVSAVAFNSTALRQETVEFRGFFNLKFNSGDLKALTVDPVNGTVDSVNPIWRAAVQLDSVNSATRLVTTYDRVNDTGIPFRFSDLNSDQKAIMDADEMNYLRGDRSQEEPAGSQRQRPLTEGLLGDIVHSAPQFVGAPRAIRRDGAPFPTVPSELYSAFKDRNAGRKELVYVAANDGMLHGFDVNTGDEKFAYVPNKLIDSSQRFKNQLDQLASLVYSHKFFVDLTPTAEDVYIPPKKTAVNKSWTSILIGGLGAGGKGYYALNVSDPDTDYSSEANAATTVLWEFTDADDTYPVDAAGIPLGGAVGALTDLAGDPIKDLGYAFSPAQVVMSNVGDGGAPAQNKWISIMGNGYNSTAGFAKLFVLFIEDGLDGWSAGDFIKLDTGEGVKTTPDPLAGLPNGLGTPAVVDVDRNGTADLVYAGDLFGNLYRFDISDSDPAKWTTTKLFQATYTDGNGVTRRQPITKQPFVFKQPHQTGFMVVFGTGSYLTETDGTSTDIESVYGIWDRGESAPVTANSNTKANRLVQQTVTNVVDETSPVFNRLRTVSANAVNYVPDDGVGGFGVYGWFFDLNMPRANNTIQGNPNADVSGNAPPLPQFPGERAVRRLVARGDSLLVTTVIPRDANTCFRSPPGATFPVDALTGGNPQRPIFDVNNDGVVDDKDLVTVGGKSYAAGILFSSDDLNGSLVDPSLLLGQGDNDFLFLSGGDQQLTVRVAGALDAKTGRLSWRELNDAN